VTCLYDLGCRSMKFNMWKPALMDIRMLEWPPPRFSIA